MLELTRGKSVHHPLSYHYKSKKLILNQQKSILLTKQQLNSLMLLYVPILMSLYSIVEYHQVI